MLGSIKDKDIFDLAYHIFMNDVYPFAEALGYSEENVQEFKVKFEKNLLDIGTCSYLLKLVKQNNYSKECVIKTLDSVSRYGSVARKQLFGEYMNRIG